MLLEELFTDVADSLRGWQGTESKIAAEDFAAQIEQLPVLDTEDATATSGVILQGETAYVDGEKVEGTMPNLGRLTYSPNDNAQSIPAGYTGGGIVNPADITVLNEYKTCLALANSIDTPIDYNSIDTTAADVREGKVVYINGEKVIGTMTEGIDTSDATATANDIVEGETAYANGVKLVGTYKGLDTSDATAISSNILVGETAYVNGAKVEGTMKNNGTLTYEPGDDEIIIPEGYTSGGKVEAADITTLDEYEACLTLANSIENLEDYNNTTATAEDIVAGKTAYSNGEKIIGNLTAVVTATEPTGENRKPLWLQKSKALCPIHFELGSMFSTNAPHVTTAMVNYLVKKDQIYTFTTDIPFSAYKVIIFLTSEKVPSIKNNTTNTTLFSTYVMSENSQTFTPIKDGYISIEISHLNGQGFYGAWDFTDDSPITKINNTYNFALVEGSEGVIESYIEPKLYIINTNGEYVEVK